MRVLLIGSATLTLLFFFASSVKAVPPWYAGTRREGVYGLWAYISTPPVPPHTVPMGEDRSGQANWVSTDGPNWIQAGWEYWHWYTTPPRKYVEWCLSNCTQPEHYGYINDFGIHTWGTVVDYMVEWIPGTTNRWCAYTDGIQRRCENIRTVPTGAQAKSEVHGSSLNELDTVFDPVYYKNPMGIWNVLDMNNFSADFPYQVEIRTNWNFRTFRRTVLPHYLPLIMR